MTLKYAYAIQTLEAEIEKLRAELTELKRFTKIHRDRQTTEAIARAKKWIKELEEAIGQLKKILANLKEQERR